MSYSFGHWPTLPKVSCQCLTYGRPHLLAEAVQSFLKQDYPGELELVVLNDHPDIRIEYNGPELSPNRTVSFINEPSRIPTIGQKRNVCVGQCSGQIICPWDDDDISLPWRVSVTIQYMTNHHHWKPHAFFKLRKHLVYGQQKTNIGHNMCGFSKDLWKQVDGYARMQSGQDQVIEREFEKTGKRQTQVIPDKELFYIYRWMNTGSYHLSQKGWNSGYEYCDQVVRKSGLKAGMHPVSPVWHENYEGLIANFLASPRLPTPQRRPARINPQRIMAMRRRIM